MLGPAKLFSSSGLLVDDNNSASTIVVSNSCQSFFCFYFRSTFALRVILQHDQVKSMERAYDIFVRLNIPPYLSVEKVHLWDRQRDRYYNHSISEKIIKVQALIKAKQRF